MSRHLERLLSIDALLRSPERQTTFSLAQALEVSDRTIRNDLAFLRDRFCAPIEYTPQKGHHYTDPQWRLPSISLSQGELFALTLGARMLEAYGGSAYAQELSSAIAQAVGEPIEVIEGPKDLEKQPRYRFYSLKVPNWTRVEQELGAGGKVLWVCNQVNTAIGVYQEAKKRGLDALLYHSRYRYEDRVQHHREVVDGFKQDKPILAIATQVAEMSLDLSATLLMSQIADPAGLIQRLGRLNRRYCGRALDAIFYPDDKVGFPYSQPELDAGLALIEAFAGEVNQAELSQWLEQSDTQGEPNKESVWLDGGWRTYSTSLREAGYTVTAILEQDLAKVKKLPARELPRFTVPLATKNTKQWQRYKFYPIAPQEAWGYDSKLGAFERGKK